MIKKQKCLTEYYPSCLFLAFKTIPGDFYPRSVKSKNVILIFQ